VGSPVQIGEAALAGAFRVAPGGGDTATPRNLRKRLSLIETWAGPLAGRHAIDCGCGEGDYVGALLARGADAWGIEFEARKVYAARGRGDERSVRIARGDLEHTGFESARFDLALVNEVLEHVPDDRAALREVWRILRPGGRLILFSPSRLHPLETHGVSTRAGRRVPHWVPGIPWLPLALGRRLLRYWARNYWPWELRALVRGCGFEIVHTGWVWQTFENISGRQPRWMRGVAPALRALAGGLERTPGLRTLAASQLIVAVRPEPGP
jgi:SAM-dependent methyltransferase